MAVGTLKSTGGRGSTFQAFSQTSATNTQMTTSTNTTGLRFLRAVTVKYSGSASVSVTVTLNSQAGAAYDTVLQTITLSSATDGVYLPTAPLPLVDGDAIDVVSPALSGGTSAVVIYTELQ